MGFSVIPEPAISGFTGPQGPAGTIPSDPVFTGSVGVNDTSGDPNIDIKKNGSMRWKIRSAGTESGSNNGSDLWVEAFADDGTTKINDPLWISRTTGQVAIGIADSSQGGVKLSVNGAIGTRDVTADPATTSMGAQLYSKAGKLWVQTASGAEKFQVNDSVWKAGNSQINGQYLWLNTAAGTYRALGFRTDSVDRWLFQVDDLAETGSALGSNFRLSSRNDDGSFNKTVIYARRDSGQIAFNTTTLHGTATVTSAGAVGIRDVSADPATVSGGVFLYSKAGLPYIKQGDGTVFQVGAGGGGTSPVSSVNTKTGAVVLAASDVNALPSDADGTTSGRVTSAKGFAVSSTDINQNPIITDSPTGQTARLAVMRVNSVDKFSLTAAGALTLGGALTAVGTSQVDNLRIGASGSFGGASGSVLAMANATTVPTTSPSGAVLYIEGGVLKVKQSDGTTVVVQNPPVTSVNGKTGAASLSASDVSAVPSSSVGAASGVASLDSSSLVPVAQIPTLAYVPTSQKAAASGVASLDSSTKVPIAQLPDPSVPSGFTPEALGVKAWAGDPDYCNSGSDYSGVGSGRLTAVYINRSMSISKIVWHMLGYSGGLLTGSWAGIYDTAGTLKGSTGDMSTATYEPATQAAAGGGWSSSPLTSTVTLSPGVYYVLWRFNYTASPVDGPALARYESASTCQSVMGNGVTVWRHASYTTSATSAPSTITIANLVRDPIRFWVALA
jgi:hypothetical protein